MRFRSSAAPTAPAAPSTPPGRGVTRRRLLATGGAAGAAAAFGGLNLAATALAAGQAVPDYLGRSSYIPLINDSRFAIGATTGKLLGVTDTQDPKLALSEDAFSLVFTLGAPIDAGIQSFSHPDLGEFEFFISPVGGRGVYEVVVNRSVNAAKHYPRATQNAATGSGPAAPPKPGTTPKGAPHVRPGHVKRIRARRLARGFACDIALEPGSQVKSAVVWLVRGGRVVGTAEVRHVHGTNVLARAQTRHRPRGGHYDVTVRTKDRHGHVEFKVAKLTLQ